MTSPYLPPALVSDMRVTGLFWIVFGALSCLSIIGAVAGVPMLLSGLRAREAADAYERAQTGGDPYALGTAYERLAAAFRMQKIYFIVSLVLFAVLMVVYIGVIFAFLSSMDGGVMRDI